MRGRAAFPALAAVFGLAACTTSPAADGWTPPFGPNTVFDAAPGAAPDNQLIVVDLRLEANAVGAAHYHPWEEYLYVIEGSAMVELEGHPVRELRAGESFIIPAEIVHTPRAGPQGVRAIVVRLHRQGDPVSVEVGP